MSLISLYQLYLFDYDKNIHTLENHISKAPKKLLSYIVEQLKISSQSMSSLVNDVSCHENREKIFVVWYDKNEFYWFNNKGDIQFTYIVRLKDFKFKHEIYFR